MKRKDYEKPTAQVVQLQHQPMLMTGSVKSTMDGTFTEVDLAREFDFEDEVEVF